MMKIKLKIKRFDPHARGSAPSATPSVDMFESYEIDCEQGMRLIDAFEFIRKELDGSLSFRWNCGAGRCGSCAVEVNGVPKLACKYKLNEAEKSNENKEITITPMKTFPIVKDLVVDLSSMREGLKKIIPFKPAQKPFYEMHEFDIQTAREMKKCIECGICLDVCHVLREHRADYLGPRFAVKAASLDMHPKDTEQRAKIMEKLGIGFCNVTKCCQTVCPENIRITDDAIIPMKEKITSMKQKEYFKRIFRFGGGKE